MSELKPTSLPLFDVATVKYGKGLATNNLLKEGYPVFGGNGQIGFYSRYLYKDPQILISCRGAASGNILVSLPNSFITSNSLIVELDDRRYFEWLKQYFFGHSLQGYATGSAQPQITVESLKLLEVPYPEYSLIENLSKKLQYISNSVLANKSESTSLAELRDTLLPKLMSGEVDVSQIDITQLNNHLSMWRRQIKYFRQFLLFP